MTRKEANWHMMHYNRLRNEVEMLRSQIKNDDLPGVSELLPPMDSEEKDQLDIALEMVVGLLGACEETLLDHSKDQKVGC